MRALKVCFFCPVYGLKFRRNTKMFRSTSTVRNQIKITDCLQISVILKIYVLRVLFVYDIPSSSRCKLRVLTANRPGLPYVILAFKSITN